MWLQYKDTTQVPEKAAVADTQVSQEVMQGPAGVVEQGVIAAPHLQLEQVILKDRQVEVVARLVAVEALWKMPAAPLLEAIFLPTESSAIEKAIFILILLLLRQLALGGVVRLVLMVVVEAAAMIIQVVKVVQAELVVVLDLVAEVAGNLIVMAPQAELGLLTFMFFHLFLLTLVCLVVRVVGVVEEKDDITRPWAELVLQVLVDQELLGSTPL